MKILGAILMLAPFVAVYLALLIYTAYWFWKCYTEGGDYKYYLGRLAIIVSFTMVGVGLVLVAKG